MQINLEKFKQNGNILHGLPSDAYTKDQFRDLENQSIFQNQWVFVGYAHELEKAGDAIPLSIAGKPIFLIRNKQNEIKAFHNACRHRCLKLIDKTSNTGNMIQCPYHSWAYDLEGSLRATPYFNGKDNTPPEGFDPKENSLVPVDCRTWHDFIFINISGTAGSFDEYIAPLAKQLSNLDFEQFVPVAALDFGIVKTNWKLLMENFIEPYHVQFVHKNTTEQPLTDHYTVIDNHCLGSACDISAEQEESTETLAVDSRYLTLFPNFVIGTYVPDQIGVHLNIPVSAGETHQRRVIYIDKNVELNDEKIEALRVLWYKVHKEDHEMCERLQEGKYSHVADEGGFLSPVWEDSVRRFQELVEQSVSPLLTQ